MRVQAVEVGVEEHYRAFRLDRHLADAIHDSVLAELAVEREQAAAGKDRVAQRLVALTHERKAVLQAHYAGAMPLDLLGAPPHVRRQINQGFLAKLFIAPDGSVERAELTEPFATLMGDGLMGDGLGDGDRRCSPVHRSPVHL